MYDLAVIGAGWAGFNAALRAKELGLSVCVIENSELGGTCLNRGCIPTKALLQSAKVYALTKKSHVFGLEPVIPVFDFLKVQERKDKIVSGLRLGLTQLLKGVEIIRGQAELSSASKLKVGEKSIEAKRIIISSGSRPQEFTPLKFDGERVLSSDDLLNLREVPDSLLIVGGGVIGCEFACLFANLGVAVTIVEKMPQILPCEDADIARKLESLCRKKGIKVHTNTDACTLDLKVYQRILVSIGRSSCYGGMNLEKAGVIVEKERIVVDEYLRTTLAHVYAAGDCTGKLMLAHFAAFQGRRAAENCVESAVQVSAESKCVPNCIFSDPEIASVGMTESFARSQGYSLRVHKFDFLGSGMARILDETEGFIKVVSDTKSEKILGAAIIGPKATELISLFCLAISNGLSVAQVKNTIFSHPTLSESISEVLRN